MRRVFVDPDSPQRDAIREAAHWILNGAIVAVPTDTLYGLAVDPFRSDAVRRLFAAKGRAAGHAIPLIAADVSQVMEQLAPLPPPTARLAERFWPGPLTVLVATPVSLARDVDGGTGTVEAPGQPQAIPDLRSPRPAESARPRHSANDAGQSGLRLYGQAPHFEATEKRGPKTEEENGLMARCPWFVVGRQA